MPTWTSRDKQILCGLFLSKFNEDGLQQLGFSSFTEAYNALAYALGAKPASIKNYRDELDPLFPNKRKGWHQRPVRTHCREVFKRYGALPLDELSTLLRQVVYSLGELDILQEQASEVEHKDGSASFAKRLLTGQAAENYFRRHYRQVELFANFGLENMTLSGCGFDFKLTQPGSDSFLGVEVKGLRGVSGTITLTDKEHTVAAAMQERYFLYVVKNWLESPSWGLYPNPAAGTPAFSRKERTVVTRYWTANV